MMPAEPVPAVVITAPDSGGSAVSVFPEHPAEVVPEQLTPTEPPSPP